MDNKKKKVIAAAVKAMVGSQGWIYIKQILETERQLLLEAMVSEDDTIANAIKRHDVRAIDLLFKKVDFYAGIETTKKDEAEEE